MSTMATDTKGRGLRRTFTEEFKAGAVRLVLEEGTTVGQVARDLDLTETALWEWVHRARADRSQGRTRQARASASTLPSVSQSVVRGHPHHGDPLSAVVRRERP